MTTGLYLMGTGDSSQEPGDFSELWDTEGIWNDILSGNCPRTLYNLRKVERIGLE